MKRVQGTFLSSAVDVICAFILGTNPVAWGSGAPVITKQPANVTVTVSKAATFTVAVTGTTPISYQWYKRGVAIGGATSASYTTPATTEADNDASFTVTAKNSAGSVTSNPAILTVGDPPVITGQPSSVTVVIPSFVFFSVTSTGTAPLSYQWYKNGVAVPTATGPSCPTGEVTLDDNGAAYSVVVTNAFGNVLSKSAILTVKSSTSGTYPIVGNWVGTAMVTTPKSTRTYQVTAAFTQTPYSILGTVQTIDQNGNRGYDLELASLNGQNLYIVRNISYGSVTVAAGFSSNQLSASFTADAKQNLSGTGLTDQLGTGQIAISSNLQTLTGTATMGLGSVTINLTRER